MSESIRLNELPARVRTRLLRKADLFPTQKLITADAMGDYIGPWEWVLEDLVKDGDAMVLYPDMSRDQYADNDTFVWGGPIDRTTFSAMEVLSSKSVSDAYPRWLIHDGTGVILRLPRHNDDDCLMTAAWMRQMEDFTGRIYACEASDRMTVKAVIHRAAGAPRDLVALLSDPK